MRGTNYIKVFFDNRRSSLLSTRGLENLITLPDYADTRTGTYGLEISLTKLDYRLNPRKGYRILARLGAGNRRIDKNPALNPQVYDGLELNSIQYSGFLDADLFIPIKDRSVITPGILSGAITGSSIFENELYRIGGNNTLRGFDEESIFASIYSIINLEYRYLLEENSFLFLFANAAYYENTAINRSISDRPYGFGAGMSFETKAGIFTISYALGSQFGNPVETRTAKVHFGITSLF
jgi:outer membrane protein assembly factor BamA